MMYVYVFDVCLIRYFQHVTIQHKYAYQETCDPEITLLKCLWKCYLTVSQVYDYGCLYVSKYVCLPENMNQG